MSPVIGIDSEKCVNCHQCISACPVKYCNNGSEDHVSVIPELCIGCGECIEACEHDARFIIDDFEKWHNDIKSGTKMIAIAAPAVAANFEGTYMNLNGWLNSIGVEAIFDVSFGAELTVKSYLDHIEKNKPKCVIAQPCPALVSYIEIYKPELIKYLAPADSPMLHTIKMIKHFYPQFSNYKVVVISPCVAKKREFEEVGQGDYNITMKRLAEYFEKNNINLRTYPEKDYENPPAERAVLFSTPGGLMRTAQRENDAILSMTRKIEGPEIIYHYLDQLNENINKKVAPLLVDCLNCELGCNGGTGTKRDKSQDEVEYLIEQRNVEMKNRYKSKVGNKPSKRKIKKTVNKYWADGIYGRDYVDRSTTKSNLIKMPNKSELQKIFESMLKYNEEDIRNCAACGYDSCEKMAIAIHNGLNKVQNCHLYLEKIDSYMHKNFDNVSSLADGNLDIRFYDEGTTEASKLFRNLNNTVDVIKQLILQIKDTTEEIASTSVQLSSSSEEMAAGSSELSQQTSQVAGSVEEISNTIIENANKSQKVSEASTSAASNARLGVEKINQSKKEIELMATSAETSASIITSLAGKTEQIGNIANVIDEIADQTNLLALNAAIEAARAGEQGRGFAVVADEVKKLAERTTTATQEIAETIRIIQNEAEKADESMSEAKNVVQKGLSSINEVDKVLTTILENSDEVANQINDIADASETQSLAIGNLSSNVEGINKVTQESSSSIQQIANSADNLNNLISHLRKLVNKFSMAEKSKNQLSHHSVRKNGKVIAN